MISFGKFACLISFLFLQSLAITTVVVDIYIQLSLFRQGKKSKSGNKKKKKQVKCLVKQFFFVYFELPLPLFSRAQIAHHDSVFFNVNPLTNKL